MVLALHRGDVPAMFVAAVSALVYVWGLALQQQGNLRAIRARRAGTARWPEPFNVILRPRWIAGLAASFAGFALHAVALKLGSLAVVQPVEMLQLVFAVPFSAWVAHTSTRASEWAAATAVVAGIAVMVVATAPTSGQASGTVGGWAWTAPLTVALTVLLMLVGWKVRAYRAALFGAACGALYGLQGAILKQAVVLPSGFNVPDLVTDWSMWVTILVGVAAMWVQNLALRAGRLASAQATMTTVTPIVSTVIGVVVFGESLATTPVALAGAAVGGALAVFGIVVLARDPVLAAADRLSRGEAQEARPVHDPSVRTGPA